MSEHVHVRAGTPEDLDGVMQLATLIHNEIGLASLAPEKVLSEVYPALHRDRGIMGVIGSPGGPLQGAILLRVGQLFYSDEDVLEEKGLFTHPDYRNSGGRGRALCEWAKRVSDSLSMPLVIGVQEEGEPESPTDTVQRVMEAISTPLNKKLKGSADDIRAICEQVARTALNATRPPNSKQRLYERHFGKPIGAVYLYRPRAVEQEAA